jgi:hypothetical protein
LPDQPVVEIDGASLPTSCSQGDGAVSRTQAIHTYQK